MKGINIFSIGKFNWALINDTLPMTITFGLYLQELLEGANMKNLVLPIAVFLVWIPIYILISSIEMYFSIEELKENNLRSQLPARSKLKLFIRKFLENVAISLILFSLMSACILMELSNNSKEDSIAFSYLTMFSIYVFCVIGSIFIKGFKIGDYFEKIEGPKDEFFNLVGTFFSIFKKWFFDKTANSLNVTNNKDNEKPE